MTTTQSTLKSNAAYNPSTLVVSHPDALDTYWRAQPDTMAKAAQLYSIDDLRAMAVFIPGASNPAALPASVIAPVTEAAMSKFVETVGEAAACGRISMRAWRKATVSELIGSQGLDEKDVDELSVIAVRPDRQGLGSGAALLSHIMKVRDR